MTKEKHDSPDKSQELFHLKPGGDADKRAFNYFLLGSGRFM